MRKGEKNREFSKSDEATYVKGMQALCNCSAVKDTPKQLKTKIKIKTVECSQLFMIDFNDSLALFDSAIHRHYHPLQSGQTCRRALCSATGGHLEVLEQC